MCCIGRTAEEERGVVSGGPGRCEEREPEPRLRRRGGVARGLIGHVRRAAWESRVLRQTIDTSAQCQAGRQAKSGLARCPVAHLGQDSSRWLAGGLSAPTAGPVGCGRACSGSTVAVPVLRCAVLCCAVPCWLSAWGLRPSSQGFGSGSLKPVRGTGRRGRAGDPIRSRERA